MGWDLGDLPTWLASVGTVGTLAVALRQVATERKRRIAQETKDRDESRREQARRIASWPGLAEPSGIITTVDLVNGSDEPVYNVVVAFVFVQGTDAPRRIEDWKALSTEKTKVFPPATTAAILAPGRWRVQLPDSADFAMSYRPGSEVAFTDRAGVSWVRRASGALEELPTDTLHYFEEFGVEKPYEFQVPRPLET